MVAFAFRSLATFDFVADARFLILENRYITDLSYLWDNLTHDYFWSSSGNAIPYWRPFTKVSWLLEHQMFGTWAGGYQLVQLGWHLLGVVGVQLLAVRFSNARALPSTSGANPPLLPHPAPAGQIMLVVLAGLLYGLQPIVIQPVCLLMARSDVLAATCTIWAVLGWWQWRQSGRALSAVVHTCATLLALASKETAVMIPLLLGVWSLLDGDGSRGRRRGLLKLLPSLLLAIVFLVLRSVVLRGAALPVALDPLRLLASLGVYLQNLVPFQLTSAVRNIARAEAHGALFLVGATATLLGAAVVVVWMARRKDVLGLALATWMLLSLAPVLVNEIPVPAISGKFPLADRWLLPALAGATLLFAHLVNRHTVNRWVLRIVTVAGGLWLVGVLLVSRDVRAEHANERAYLDWEDRQYLATPSAYRTSEDECRRMDRAVIRAHLEDRLAEVIARSEAAIRSCGRSQSRQFNLFSALVRAGRFEEAEPLANDLVAHPPPDRRDMGAMLYLSGQVFLSRGKPEVAEGLLLRARRAGLRTCGIELHLARAAEARGQPALAAGRLEAAHLCAGSSDPQALLSAGWLWIRAGRVDRAQQTVETVKQRFRLSAAQEEQLRRLARSLEVR